jgi:hypothetical protein
MGEEMTTKILLLNKPVTLAFHTYCYEWGLFEQIACCKEFIKDTVPQAEIVILSSSMDTQEIVSSFEKSTIVIPSKLIFSLTPSIADVSVKHLTDAGFTIVEVIPNAKLDSNPTDMSRLLLEGDSKYTSFFYSCYAKHARFSLQQLADRMEQYILREYNALPESPRTPPSRPDSKGVIEHYFSDLNTLMLDQINGATDDNDSLHDDEDK